MSADEKVNTIVMKMFRGGTGYIGCREPGKSDHLRGCPEAKVYQSEAHDGEYGCDTGCEYVTFTATIKCPHESEEYEYGEFGELADWIRLLDRGAL